MTSKVIGSNPISEANSKNFLSDNDSFSSGRTERRDGKESLCPKSAEYVKRTAKLFESVRSPVEGHPQLERKASETTDFRSSRRMTNGTAKESVDITDFAKKPSYLGVSCSNSGYRNVINYDSKLREGFWTSTNQRESLVLSNHRLRDSSPLKFEQEYRSLNGFEAKTISGGTRRDNSISLPQCSLGEFVNISTSTKTISTFRSVCNKEDEAQYTDVKCNGNKGTDETWRRSQSSYTSLGISPRILKSPEKNCNSFIRSINSFESNCRKSDGEVPRVSTCRRTRYESTGYTPSNSIQQRIERLYGPGALAQGFYFQNAPTKTKSKITDLLEDSAPVRMSESIGQSVKSSIESIPDLLPAAPEVVLPIEKYSPGEEVNGTLDEDACSEKNGRYFLKLLQKETDRLESLASFADSELENGENLPEEASGKLRAAAGKARLLVRQKLHQFEGLCQKNLNEKPGEQFPTTSEDLAGFWDMVMLQVVQVYGVFDEIKELKKNNWKAATIKDEGIGGETTANADAVKKTVRKNPPAGVNAEKNQKAEMARKARDETRKKMMEERRKKMKELRENKTVGNEGEIEIFAK